MYIDFYLVLKISMSSPLENKNGIINDIIDDIINKLEINNYDLNGDTQLTAACSNSDIIMVEKLLISGTDPNKLTNDGWSPLGIASQEGNLQIVSKLLKFGANVNAQIPGNMNCSALHIASCGINPDGKIKDHFAIVKILLDHNANPNARTSNLRTPLMFASGIVLSDESGINSAKIVTALIKGGAIIDIESIQFDNKKRHMLYISPYFDETALYVAVNSGNKYAALELLKLGANMHIKCKKNNHMYITPYNFCCIKYKKSIVALYKYEFNFEQSVPKLKTYFNKTLQDLEIMFNNFKSFNKFPCNKIIYKN